MRFAYIELNTISFKRAIFQAIGLLLVRVFWQQLPWFDQNKTEVFEKDIFQKI